MTIEEIKKRINLLKEYIPVRRRWLPKSNAQCIQQIKQSLNKREAELKLLEEELERRNC